MILYFLKAPTLSIYVTSFLSIPCLSNSEYWSQKHSQSGNIHSINKMFMSQLRTYLTLSNIKWGTDLGTLVVPFSLQTFHPLHLLKYANNLQIRVKSAKNNVSMN